MDCLDKKKPDNNGKGETKARKAMVANFENSAGSLGTLLKNVGNQKKET